MSDKFEDKVGPRFNVCNEILGSAESIETSKAIRASHKGLGLMWKREYRRNLSDGCFVRLDKCNSSPKAKFQIKGADQQVINWLESAQQNLSMSY